MVMQVRARLALIHAQWTPGDKRHIFHLILQCVGVVFFCLSERLETVFYFFPPPGKGLSLLTLILDLRHQQVQNVFLLEL